jgi:hypothetical protein
MAAIDITLPDDLMQALTPPDCASLQLPAVSVTPPSLTLPIGGSFQGVADFTRGIPTDCSMNFSIMLQVAPLMASMACLLKVLNFIGTVVSIIKDITSPFNLVAGILKIISAAGALAGCLDMALPPYLPTLCFLKDLLSLVANLLLCTVQALESVLNILSGLELQISAAQEAGNGDLLAALTCAQQNASTSAAGTMQALQPVTVLLTLAGTFMEIAQQPALNITLPSAIDPSDLEGMETMLQTLGTIAQDIKKIADALPCPS